jgi:hypothetical protein
MSRAGGAHGVTRRSCKRTASFHFGRTGSPLPPFVGGARLARECEPYVGRVEMRDLGASAKFDPKSRAEVSGHPWQ